MALIDISTNKMFPVKRKIKVGVITIDYNKNEAVCPFEILHFGQDNKRLGKMIPNVSGQFKITNDRQVNDTTGVKIPIPDSIYDENGNDITPAIVGPKEFNFLNNQLLKKDINPEVLIVQRILVADGLGLFDDYDNLMSL
jgi:hypothetical protein